MVDERQPPDAPPVPHPDRRWMWDNICKVDELLDDCEALAAAPRPDGPQRTDRAESTAPPPPKRTP